MRAFVLALVLVFLLERLTSRHIVLALAISGTATE